MHTYRYRISASHKICKFLMVSKDCNILSNNFHCRFYMHLMHACRLKTGFPTIFEIVSAKSEGGVKHICV